MSLHIFISFLSHALQAASMMCSIKKGTLHDKFWCSQHPPPFRKPPSRWTWTIPKRQVGFSCLPISSAMILRWSPKHTTRAPGWGPWVPVWILYPNGSGLVAEWLKIMSVDIYVDKYDSLCLLYPHVIVKPSRTLATWNIGVSKCVCFKMFNWITLW